DQRHGTSPARPHRHQGQSPVSRGDDVRRLGEPRPRRVGAHHPLGARRGDQLHRHRRCLRARGVRGDRRPSARRRPARARRPGHQGARLDGRRPQPVRKLAAVDNAGGRGLAAAAADRLDRPLPDPPARARHRHRRDARRAQRSRQAGQGARDRLVHLPGERDRRGAVGRRAARTRALPLRAAAVLAAGARRRGRRPADLPTPRNGRDPVESARRRLAVGAPPPGRRATGVRASAAPPASLRHVAAGQPAQAGGRGCARAAGGGLRHDADRDGAGLRHPPSGGDRGDHRPADDGAPRIAAAGDGDRLVRRAAGRDRRDRPAGPQRQPGRWRLDEPGAGEGGAAATGV
ncbi:MAG: Oxidoreductase, partial [uncultured Solirubrobacteraceae bacterium]